MRESVKERFVRVCVCVCVFVCLSVCVRETHLDGRGGFTALPMIAARIDIIFARGGFRRLRRGLARPAIAPRSTYSMYVHIMIVIMWGARMNSRVERERKRERMSEREGWVGESEARGREKETPLRTMAQSPLAKGRDSGCPHLSFSLSLCLSQS